MRRDPCTIGSALLLSAVAWGLISSQWLWAPEGDYLDWMRLRLSLWCGEVPAYCVGAVGALLVMAGQFRADG